MNKSDTDKLLKLFGMYTSANKHEREAAYAKLDKLLKRLGKTWNDLPALLAQARPNDTVADTSDQEHEAAAETGDNPNGAEAFDSLCECLRLFLYVKPHEHVAIALWIMHTFLFDRYRITPRLALLSPVRGCGKSTALDLLEALVPHAKKFDHTSAAGIYHVLDNIPKPTLLLDEVDNLNLAKEEAAAIRAVLNSGHKVGGKKRIKDHEFSLFAPVAFGAIGSLPAPLMQRSIVVQMQRAPRDANIRRLDLSDKELDMALHNLRGYIYRWSQAVVLNRDPPMPERLHNRRADNWRVLLAIADACGRGDVARDAALAMSREHQDEDPAVELLTDVRGIFDRRGVDRMTGKTLVEELHDLDGAPWSEWRGERGNQQPRPISQPQLAILLRPFRIFPKSIWPPGPRTRGVKSAKGYYRKDFELAWASYCPEDGTPAQPSSVKHLVRHMRAAQGVG